MMRLSSLVGVEILYTDIHYTHTHVQAKPYEQKSNTQTHRHASNEAKLHRESIRRRKTNAITAMNDTQHPRNTRGCVVWGGSNRLLMQTPRSTHAHRSRKRSRLLQGPYFIILVNICPATTITYVLRGYNYSGLTWHSFSNRAPL